MPSDSVVAFLDRARASRLLPPDQIDNLFDQPDAPQVSVAAVCDYLQTRGALTGYQVERIREGKSDELTFAGYPVVGELGPCPGGTAYRALHPSLRTPVILRRLCRDSIEPGESVEAFVRRAQAAGPVVQRHLAHLLDAGLAGDEPYAVLEPFGGADLQTLVNDIGPMPAALATEYGRQIATALRAAHEHGLVHGAVRPVAVFAGPLVPMSKPRPDGTPRFRPGPTASTKLFGLGLVPRSAGTEPTAADDMHGLGATLYFLLTARPASDDPVSLAALRPDIRPELVELVNALMAKDPAARPTAAEAVARLTNPKAPPVASSPPTAPDIDAILAELTPTSAAEAPAGGWVVVPYQESTELDAPTFTPAAYTGWTPPHDSSAEGTRPAPRRVEEEKSHRMWWWIGVGAGLQVLALLGWIYLFAQPGCSNQDTETPPKKLHPQRK